MSDSRKIIDIAGIIESAFDGKYNTIGVKSEIKTLPADNRLIQINNYLFPIVCLDGWGLVDYFIDRQKNDIADLSNDSSIDLNVVNQYINEDSIIINDDCAKAIMKELLSPGYIKSNPGLWNELIKLDWKSVNDIITNSVFDKDPETLDELANSLSTCINMNINTIFSVEKIVQKYTNDEIFAGLYGKIDTNKIFEFIQKLRRENPTIYNTCINKQMNIEFDNMLSRKWSDYYTTSTNSPTGKIFDMVNNALDRINSITNNLFNRIASLFDSKTMVLSGGSLIRAILQKDLPGHFDFDIFGTSLGFMELIEALRDIYDSIILCHEYNCVFDILIPGHKIILQYIITDKPLEWIIGTKIRHGFDLEHLKNIIVYNEEKSKLELLCTYNSFYALKRWETNQSTDVKGVLQPHRFMKATNIMPIKKTPIFAEYSAHLFGKSATKKDFKYIHVPAEYDERNYNFILRQIYNIKDDYGIYFIGKEITRIYSYTDVHHLTQKEFMDNILSVVSTDKKSDMETTNLNTLSNKKEEEKEKPEKRADYNDFMSIPHTPVYNIYSGLIPPVKIIKSLGKQLFLAKPYVVGPIMEKILRNQEYIVLKFEKTEKNTVFPDNVLYCKIENTFSKKIHDVQLCEDEPWMPCRVLNVVNHFRYADLE